jgi:hypothetical protein
MSNPRRSHPPPAPLSPAEEMLFLLRQIAADIAAMRRAGEADATPDVAPPDQVVDQKDLLTPQQAGAIAVRDASTMRRWYRETPNIGTIIGGTLFIYKTKLLERLAGTKSRVD